MSVMHEVVLPAMVAAKMASFLRPAEDLRRQQSVLTCALGAVTGSSGTSVMGTPE